MLLSPGFPSAFTRDGVTIRIWELSDAPALAAALSRSYRHMRPFVYWVTRDVSAARAARRIAEWRARYESGLDLQFGVFVGGQLLGGAGFQRCFGADRRRAELSMWVAADFAGQGWGTLAAELLVEWGFSEWGFELLVAAHDADNAASRRVVEKLGFVRSDSANQVVPRRHGVVEWRLPKARWENRHSIVA